jgi:hypothetical protein
MTKVINLLKNNKNYTNNNLLYIDCIFLNAKRVTLFKYNPFTLIFAPLFNERCSHQSQLIYITIYKLDA